MIIAPPCATPARSSRRRRELSPFPTGGVTPANAAALVGRRGQSNAKASTVRISFPQTKYDSINGDLRPSTSPTSWLDFFGGRLLVEARFLTTMLNGYQTGTTVTVPDDQRLLRPPGRQRLRYRDRPASGSTDLAHMANSYGFTRTWEVNRRPARQARRLASSAASSAMAVASDESEHLSTAPTPRRLPPLWRAAIPMSSFDPYGLHRTSAATYSPRSTTRSSSRRRSPRMTDAQVIAQRHACSSCPAEA